MTKKTYANSYLIPSTKKNGKFEKKNLMRTTSIKNVNIREVFPLTPLTPRPQRWRIISAT